MHNTNIYTHNNPKILVDGWRERITSLSPRLGLTERRLVGWLVGFYPQGQRKVIFVSSKTQVCSPTCILSDQGDPFGVRPGSLTQVTSMEG